MISITDKEKALANLARLVVQFPRGKSSQTIFDRDTARDTGFLRVGFAERARLFLAEMGFRYCTVCGCSDYDACAPACHWVFLDRCSACGDEDGKGRV